MCSRMEAALRKDESSSPFSLFGFEQKNTKTALT